MGSCVGPKLLKAWFSWLKGGCLLRLLGLPCALLALHLELYGTSPEATSLILKRLCRRIRLSNILRILKKRGHGRPVNSFFFVGGADVMDRAQSPQSSRPRSLTRKRSRTLREEPQPSPSQSPSGGSPSLQVSPPHAHQHPPTTAHTASNSAASQRPSNSAMSSSSHTRSMSHAGVVQQGKRLSLQFPIQPSAAGSNSPRFSPRSRPQSWAVTPSPTHSDVASSPTENNFLAVLAAQERYVLELKEELAKAEEDLKRVKKHWATHQSLKQRNELRRVTQLQPLSSTLADFRSDQDDEDGSTAWMQKEMERRKSLLSNAKSSHRKVFSGSRHLRTLSLLSPDRPYSPSFPQPADARGSLDEPYKRPQQPLLRPSTSSDYAEKAANIARHPERYDLSGLSNMQRDALLQTGKRMATDFKDGLLTFIEDIRQATVGEDAISQEDASAARVGGVSANSRNASTSRPSLVRAPSSSHKSTTRHSEDIAEDFWKSHGLSEPTTTPTMKKTHTAKQSRTPQKQPAPEEDFDGWDDWDAPSDNKTAPDSDDSEDEGMSGQASSRTSARYHSKRHDSKASTLTASSIDDAALRERDPKRNSIPWPDLVKLSPTNLKRTASHLMKEWEKNLTPPPEARENGQHSGDYIGRSASPAALP